MNDGLYSSNYFTFVLKNRHVIYESENAMDFCLLSDVVGVSVVFTTRCSVGQ